MTATPIQTPNAPEAIGPYAQAVEAGGLVFCSGQIPINPATGNIEKAGAAEQTLQVLLNLKAVLEAAGSGLGKVVKTTDRKSVV
jgi:2-iminobutanoate/2-iminopropanoate deaminase